MTDTPTNGTESVALDAATTSSNGRPSLQEVVREAPIAEVVVHARGAIVTRRFHLDSTDPTTKFALICPEITMRADVTSVRCSVSSGRRVHSLNTRIRLPEHDTGTGPSRKRVEELDRRIERLNDEHGILTRRVESLAGTDIRPALGRSLREEGAAARSRDALAAAALLDDRVQALTSRLAEIEAEHRRVSRKRDAAVLADLQTSSEERKGTSAPSREIVVVFEPGVGEGLVELSYVVDPARWWPAYTLRVNEDGRNASLLLEANVAQDTGEDWTGVKMGLATSEIVSDAQLPRLPSYRLGRSQPEPPRAFRAPPKGVERLFGSYDLAMKGATPTPTPPPARRAGKPASLPEEMNVSGAEYAFEEAEMSASFGAPQFQAAPMAKKESKSMARSRSAAPMPQSASLMSADSLAPGGGGANLGGLADEEADLSTPTHMGVEPGDGWLDFDSVVLAPAASHLRGKLRKRTSGGGTRHGSLNDANRRAQAAGGVDPRVSSGYFDHRYDAQARVDVLSDGALHRVEVSEASCPSTLGWRANPREDAAVFREVALDNPFPSPLLAGPLDVYVAGSLVANTELATVDRGGAIQAGLGVDERIRVARNARVREESAGLLGGKREVDHFIDIELASSLGFDAVVEVVDRIPVSRDEHVDVDMFECAPQADEYDQADRDAPLEGGYRWRVELLAGDQATIRFAYRIKLRAKDELVGGNRRE